MLSLIGYVSDERFVAVPDALLEFVQRAADKSFEARSRQASGAGVLGHCRRWRIQDCHPEARVRGEIQPRHAPGRDAAPLPAALRRPLGLRVAEVGAEWREVGVPRSLGGAVQARTVAVRGGTGVRAGLGLARRARPARGDAGHARRRLHANRCRVEQGRVRELRSLATRARAGTQRAVLLPRPSTASGRQFGFPWIVAPAKPVAKLAVLASNITWNAYNNFGGRSNYIHPDGLPPTPTVNARVELKRYSDAGFFTWGADYYPPLSFDRPEPFNHIDFAERITDPIEGRRGVPPRPRPEWRLLGWLESRGFAYDYFAETQLDDGTLDLSAYRVLVTAVHPEYWTRRMYERGQAVGVRERRAAGLPRRQRAELRGGTAPRRSGVLYHNGKLTGLERGRAGRVREPVRDAPRIRGESARVSNT